MINKNFLEQIDDETLAKLIDTTLRFEKNQKAGGMKINILKIVSAAAIILLVIGLINIMPVFLTTYNIDDNTNNAKTNAANITTTINNTTNSGDFTEPVALFVPPIVEKTFFEEKILANMTNKLEYNRMCAYYTLKDPTNSDLTEDAKKEMINEYPICERVPVYILDLHASDRELMQLLGYLKVYTTLTGNDLIQMYIDNGIPYENLPMFTGDIIEYSTTEAASAIEQQQSEPTGTGMLYSGPSGVFEAPHYGLNTAADGTEYIEFKNKYLYAALMEYFGLDRWYNYITPDMLKQITSININVKPEYNYLYDNIGLRDEFNLNCQYLEYTINGKTLDILPEKFIEGGVLEYTLETESIDISQYFDYESGYQSESGNYISGYYIPKATLSTDDKLFIYGILAKSAAMRMAVYNNDDGSYFTVPMSSSIFVLGLPTRYYDQHEYDVSDIAYMPNLQEFHVADMSVVKK